MPEREEEGQEIENFFEIMKENFPNLAKEIDSLSFQEVQKAQRVPKKLDPRRNTPRHIIITLSEIKEKERILKAAREKERVTYKGVLIRLSADFSKETLQARRGWKEVFKVMKDKDLHPRLLYPAKLSFRMEGQINCFPDMVKLRVHHTKPLLFEMLKKLKKKIKSMNIKMAINSQLSNEPKKQKQTKLEQLEQEQNHRNGDHMEGYQWWSGRGTDGGKVQSISSINGR